MPKEMEPAPISELKDQELKVTVLPPATEEDMVTSEAIHDTKARYKSLGIDPENYPENFAKIVAERKRKIRKIVSPHTEELTGRRKIKKK